MEKKYVLTKESKRVRGKTVYRIKALRNGLSFSQGELGGWVESENNLSQKGNCWISKQAVVMDNAVAKGDCNITDSVMICENAQISDTVLIREDVMVRGSAKIYGNVYIKDRVTVTGNSLIYDEAELLDKAYIRDSTVCENSIVKGESRIIEGSTVKGNSLIEGNSLINNCTIEGKSIINNMLLVQVQIKEIPLQIQGTRHHLYYSGKRKLTIGCTEQPIDWWLKNYKEIGSRNSYTKEQIKEYKNYIDLFNKKYNKPKSLESWVIKFLIIFSNKT